MTDSSEVQEKESSSTITAASGLLSSSRQEFAENEDSQITMQRSQTGSRSRAQRHADVENLMMSNLEWTSPSASRPSARRPSLAPSLPESYASDSSRRPRVARTDTQVADIPVIEPGSPEDGTNLRRSLEINMKDLVGDAVGNMSISPSSRDIVLAARKGLFIIDLESPLEVPRFLPQGGTWDVADVQWNPHPSRAQYIVSTSSEKMLIWNLGLTGKTSIEHILKSHYRAITDFNWHTTECDVVASTGIDSWIWAWDLREPRKPAFGLSAFKAAGTQVKWNRQDGNILASSHANEVLIWDRRKGSLPVTRISAHTSKIYGIDWSHHHRNEIVTCSLDTTIKTWNINDCTAPTSLIQTTYPVWRARNLPFGHGVLSLPQRGETRLEMYAKSETQTLVETFDGHSDVVKEFVWRKGGPDEFQLITWSKDRTLRFWPVGVEVMQRVGYYPEIIRGRSQGREDMALTTSYRNPPEIKEQFPALSAPVGHRSILAEVRAGLPPKSQNPVAYPHPNSAARASLSENTQLIPTGTDAKPMTLAGRNRGGTMSRGAIGGKSVAPMDAFAWLSNVKVGSKRGSSSGAGSAEVESGASSRLHSRSRPSSGNDRGDSGNRRQRSASRSRTTDDRRETENTQSLQDEITSVLTKLAHTKVKLEKHDLAKRRTCTLGLHGPWGETSSVFMRLTFTFPSKYPHGSHPEGTPSVELERNPLISIRDRAFILKRLRAIRERKRPCLEACLRFLLFADEEQGGRPPLMDSESSDDEEPVKGKSKEFTVSLLRNNKNLAEPRTSQGAFGPNGELVCFFRAPPRIVRNVLRGLAESSPKPSDEPQQPSAEPPQQSRLFQSPALVSDAVRRLSLASRDRVVTPIDPRKPENDHNILRTMTNLLTVSQHKVQRDSESKHYGGMSKNYALLPTLRSNVFMMDTTNIAGADKKVALEYVFRSNTLPEVCEKNAQVAREYGRYDHERVFRTLQTLFRTPRDTDGESQTDSGGSFASDLLAGQLVVRLYSDLSKAKDIQMLAMLSMLILQTPHVAVKELLSQRHKSDILIPRLAPLKTGGMDYFSLARSINNLPSPMSPAWPHIPSPAAPPLAPSISSSNSSRGSWSSLFNTGSMRQFMNGVQDTLKEGLTTPTDLPGVMTEAHLATISEKISRGGQRSDPRAKGMRRDSTLQPPAILSRSWNEVVPQTPKSLSVSFSSAGHRRPALQLMDSSPFGHHEKRLVFFEPASETESPTPLFDADLIKQFTTHVYIYSEILFRWKLFHKRLELLKAVDRPDVQFEKNEPHKIGLIRMCVREDCRMLLPEKTNMCQHCNTPAPLPACTICRLPVKGLSRSCLRCYHVTHVTCWDTLDVPICPTGCGCFCTSIDGIYTRPSTRLGFSPAINTLILTVPP